MTSSDPAIRVPSDGKPKFVMTGIEKPDGTVRLHASRDLGGTVGFGQRPDPKNQYGPPVMHIDADMPNMLTIDADTWGHAFNRLFEIWANWDTRELGEARKARPGKVVTAPTEFGSGELPPATGREPEQ